MKFHFPKCSDSLSSEAEILNKHLYCCHLVTYHSVNIVILQKFQNFPTTSQFQYLLTPTSLCFFQFVITEYRKLKLKALVWCLTIS